MIVVRGTTIMLTARRPTSACSRRPAAAADASVRRINDYSRPCLVANIAAGVTRFTEGSGV